MTAPDPDPYTKFYKSRKNEESRIYSSAILEYLSKQPGWVRTKTIRDALVVTQKEKPIKPRDQKIGWEVFNKKILEETGKKIPNESTFFSIMKGLVGAGLVQKRESERTGPGKNPTEYHLSETYPNDFFWSVEGQALLSRKLSLRLDAAEKMLELHHSNDPSYIASLETEKWGRENIPHFDELMQTKTEAEFLKIFQKRK